MEALAAGRPRSPAGVGDRLGEEWWCRGPPASGLPRSVSAGVSMRRPQAPRGVSGGAGRRTRRPPLGVAGPTAARSTAQSPGPAV